MNFPKPFKICCRKLPPTLTKEEFCNIDLIQKYSQNNPIDIKYYPAEMVGDTAAPPTSMAMITINGDYQNTEVFLQRLSKQKFKFHTGESISPQIEAAPCQSLFIKNHPTQPKQPAPIDNDPDFVSFCKTFEESFTPETDVNLDTLLDDDDSIDPNKMLNQMNQKLIEKTKGNEKQQKNRNPQANSGKKKKKYNKGKKGNQ